jgi:uncharacterized protein YbjT (DUF2867 family)
VRNKRAEEAVIARSDLDWTVVRASGMVDGPRRTLSVSADGSYAGMTITRLDTAEFMVDQLTDPRYVGRTPQIAST